MIFKKFISKKLKILISTYLIFHSVEIEPATWNLNANGNWNVNGNWTLPAIFPNAIDAQAILGPIISANRTITLGQNITLGSLSITDNNNYLMSGNQFIFDVSSGNAVITITNVSGNGAHRINSSILLNDPLIITQGSTGVFTIAGIVSGTGSVTKEGANALTVLSTNTYTGGTFINNGTFNYNANGAIPGVSSVTLGDGSGASASAILNINTSMTALQSISLTTNSDGIINQASNQIVRLTRLSGNGQANLTTATGQLFEISAAGGNSSFSGVLSGGVTSASLDPDTGSRLFKNGSSTLTLTGNANTYVARTFIDNQSAINAQADNALGSTGVNSGVFVISGGALEMEGSTLAINKRLRLNGTGISSTGALRNISGTNTFSGIVDIGWSGGTVVASNASIGADSGSSLNLSNIVQGSNNFAKVGTGTLIFSGGSANTYTGLTTVSEGTLSLNKTAGVNAIVGNITISGGTTQLGASNQIANASNVIVDSGSFNLNSNTETISTLTMNGGTAGGGTLSLASTATALTMRDASITGQVNLTGASGGAVIFDATNNGTATIQNLDLSTVTRSFNIADGTAATDMDITGIISGTGGVTKIGNGTLNFSGSSVNTYSGLTTVSAGGLSLSKTAGINSIAGNVTISGGAVQLNTSDQIADASNITISSGDFNLNSNTETINSLTYNGGTAGGGTLSLASTATALTMRNTTLTGQVNLTGGSGGAVVFDATNNGTSTIQNLDLSTVTRSFNIADGTAATDMDITGIISGTGGVTKIGVGTLNFSGGSANTYSGLTTVSAGTLSLNKTSGINAINGDMTISGGTLFFEAADQVSNTSNVTLETGTLNLNNNSTTFGSFTFNGGSASLGSGELSLASSTTALTMRDTTLTGQVNLTGTTGGDVIFDATNNGTASIQNINLNSAAYIFNINNGIAATDMDIIGVISGSGGITKINTGTLNLSGGTPNTFLGLFTVSDGTVSLNKTFGTTSISGNILINGGILLLGTGNQIDNASNIELSSGTFNLNGNSDAVGSFVFNGGSYLDGGATLSLESISTALTMRDTTITGQVNLTGPSGGDVVFDAINNGTASIQNLDLGSANRTFNISEGTALIDMDVGGVISGTSGIIKSGSGILDFSGTSANIYSGITTISDGTLSLNKTSGINAIAGNISVNGGTLSLGASNQIANTSNMTVSSGTFDLNANTETISSLTYNGGDIVNGDLSLSSTTVALTMRNITLTEQINLIGATGGDVVFDPTNAGTAIIDSIDLGGSNRTFNIPIGSMIVNASTSSGGGLIKEGSGLLQLPGTHTYPGGASSVLNGRLTVDGSLTTATLNVDSSGIVNGAGSITADMTLNGTLQPGDSIGTISLVGNQIFADGSVLEIELNPSVSDLVDITGTLTINPGAILTIIPESGDYPDQFSFTIIQTTGGITGEFTNVFSTLPFFPPNIVYTSNNVLLQVSMLSFFSLVNTGNPGAVAQYLDQLNPPAGSDLESVISLLKMSPNVESLRDALNQMQPSMLKGLAISQENNAVRIGLAIAHRKKEKSKLCKIDFKKKGSVWVSVLGDMYRQRTIEDEPGFYTQSIGNIIGIDYQTDFNLLIGIAGAHTYSYAKWDCSRGHGSIQSGHGIVYANWLNNSFFIDSVILGSYSRYHEDRHLNFFDLKRSAKASFSGANFASQLEFGFILQKSAFEMRPFACMQYIYLHQNGFNENGANSLNLNVKNSNYQYLRTEIGNYFIQCIKKIDSSIQFEEKLSYIHENRFNGEKYTASLINSGGSFQVIGLNPDRNLFSPGFSMTYISADESCNFSLKYEGEFGRKYRDHNILGQFIYKF